MLYLGIFAFTNITYNMEPCNFRYVFTKSSKRNMRDSKLSFHCLLYRKVATSTTMNFCDKMLDMYDISVTYWTKKIYSSFRKCG